MGKKYLVIAKEYETGRHDLRTAEVTRDGPLWNGLPHWCAGLSQDWEAWADSAAVGDHLDLPVLVVVRIR